MPSDYIQIVLPATDMRAHGHITMDEVMRFNIGTDTLYSDDHDATTEPRVIECPAIYQDAILERLEATKPTRIEWLEALASKRRCPVPGALLGKRDRLKAELADVEAQIDHHNEFYSRVAKQAAWARGQLSGTTV